MASSINANDPYEQLISAIIRTERGPQLRLKEQQKTQKATQTVLDSFSTSLSSLRLVAQDLKDPAATPLKARRADVSGTGIEVVAADRASVGGHTVTVERLARADMRLSRQQTVSGTSLVDFFATNGPQTFSLEVPAPTTASPAARVSLSVTVNPTGTTDADVLGEIKAAIAAAGDAAVSAGSLKSAQKPAVSVVHETATTARLSLQSTATGFAGRFAFTDSAAGLVNLLQLDRTALAGVDNGDGAGTAAGGPVAAVGSDEVTSDLNARFLLDGLRLYRDRNEVTDALDGVTLRLKTAGEATFTVAADAEAGAARIEEFVKQYNKLVEFLRRKTGVDTEARTRGELAGDAAATSLGTGLRGDLGRAVPGQIDGMSGLKDLGIEVGQDGKLKILDRSRLVEALNATPEAVQTLFGGADGLALRVVSRLDGLLGSSTDGITTPGLLDSRKTINLAAQRRLDQRIKAWDERLKQREDSLRTQFARLQQTISSFQGQQNMLVNFIGY